MLVLAALMLPAPSSAQTAPMAYTANCQMCHQAAGAGIPGQFPRVAGRAGAIAAKPAGRAYLIDVLLNGMAGRMMVDGKPIMGVMPPFARLSDTDIAATLTYVTKLPGGPPRIAPFAAAEIKAARAAPKKSATEMKTVREQLAAQGLIP
ncbi:c-type cytochrome [Sphingomonas profundi]|uniref:c-type cytochrome n=1 Tax=Alterirhizorhabdus profundi TaxID=2681549 RepID=UPI0018D0EE3E|nr:cytochrome c [Sphingomonas profundi]